MTQEISSLMDGELDPAQAGHVVRGCCENPEAAEKWATYHLIGDVMRGGKPHPTRTAQLVGEALNKEPAIIARPKRTIDTPFARYALAAAASVATIGVVGWLGTQGGQVGAGAPLVSKAATGIQPVANTARVPAQSPSVDVQDYMPAHKQLPYRPVVNNAPVQQPATATR
jgi:sigma-E factor negative regulatory protein RseA